MSKIEPIDWRTYLRNIRHVPAPNEEQIENYLYYLPDMHSWYKQLSKGDKWVFALHDKFPEWPRKLEDVTKYGFLQLFWFQEKDGNLKVVDSSKNPLEIIPEDIVNLSVGVTRDCSDYANTTKFRESIDQMLSMISEKRERYNLEYYGGSHGFLMGEQLY